jgi:hypothetical protein
MMEYPFKASATRVGHIYKDAVIAAFKEDDAGLSDFVDTLKTNDSDKYTFMTLTRALEAHTQFLISRTRGTVNRIAQVPGPDASIVASMTLLRIFEQEHQKGGNQKKWRGTVRRKDRRKRRHGSRRR